MLIGCIPHSGLGPPRLMVKTSHRLACRPVRGGSSLVVAPSSQMMLTCLKYTLYPVSVLISSRFCSVLHFTDLTCMPDPICVLT